MKLKIQSRSDAGRAAVSKLRAGLTTEVMRKVAEKTAFRTHAELVKKTPKRWTGLTRRSWSVEQTGPAAYRVTNNNRVMMYLEAGTQTPIRPKIKKYLYIPLNAKAAIGGWHAGLVMGRDYILKRWVRGIKARWIVRAQRPVTHRWFVEEAKKAIRRILQK